MVTNYYEQSAYEALLLHHSASVPMDFVAL